MKNVSLEAIRKELGGVSDTEFIPALKNHKEVNLLESYEIPERGAEVKLFQLNETYIVYSYLPGVIDRIGITPVRVSAIIIFAQEAYKIQNY
jgi:hypothetical protein